MSTHVELFQLILGRTTTKAVERIVAAGYRKPMHLSPGKYRNERGVTLEVEALRMDRNILGAVWDAKILDDVFGTRYMVVTPEGLLDAGYTRIEETS
jgi:hypothetical protein